MKIYKLITPNISINNIIISKSYFKQENKLNSEIYRHFSLETIQIYTEILEDFGILFKIDVNRLIKKSDLYYEEIRNEANRGGNILDEDQESVYENDYFSDYSDDNYLKGIKQLFKSLDK